MSLIRGFFTFCFEMFFGCRHNRLTRPFTLEDHTYKVCLDCGKQVFYSADRMKPLTVRELRQLRAAESAANVIPWTAKLRKGLTPRKSKAVA